MQSKIWVLLLTVALCAAASAQSHPYKKLDDIKFTWGQSLELVLEQQTGYTDGEPDQAPARIRVLKDGKPLANLTLKWGVSMYAGELANLATFPPNLVKSKYLLFATIAKDKPPLLLVIGPAPGDTNGAVYAFALDANGMPHAVLNEEQFGFSSFADVDGDGTMEIVGPLCAPTGGGGEPGIYDPYLVWKLGADGFKEVDALTVKYNKEHYVWAGDRCREDSVVVQDKSGKWKLVGLEEWEKEKAKQQK